MSFRAHSAAVAISLTVALWGNGCRKTAGPSQPPRPTLGAVSLRDLTPPDASPLPLDVPAIEVALRNRLLGTGLFVGPTDAATKGPVVRVRGEFGVDGAEVDGKGMARAVVRLRIDTRPSDSPGAWEEDVQGQGDQSYVVSREKSQSASQAAAKRELFHKLVLRISGDLVDGLAARRKLRDATPEAIHAALTADAGELREEAIRVAGQRQLTNEVPLLLRLLNDPEEGTRDAAMGALIAMKERRAVSELTKSRSLRDRREMRKILEAVSILGGQEALDYLSFVAETHDDDEIRNEAIAAKARLDRRQADAAKAR